MKKFTTTLIAILVLPLMAAMTVSCSDDDASSSNNVQTYICDTCSDTPDALAVNDASIKGVYKGIFIGSTGTLYFNIQNGSNNISATMVIDDVTVALTSTVEVQDGQAYVAPFTGMMNGSPVSITFAVGMGGTNPTVVTSSIPGHPNAVFSVYKETSTSLIEAFEGTYTRTGGETGTFNILLSRSLAIWGGIARKGGTTETSSIGGSINSSGQIIDEDSNRIMGTINGDVLTGSFTDGENATVNITGYRTL